MTLGMPYGEFSDVSIPNAPAPGTYRDYHEPFVGAYWGHVLGVLGMVQPYTFPFDIMPLADCAALAAHLIPSSARLEAWSAKPQRIVGVVQMVAITQADGVRRDR